MKKLLAVLIISGCVALPPVNAPQIPASQARNPSAKEAVEAYLRVGTRIERVAERVCRQKNSSKPKSYCDFQLKVDHSPTNVPNAFQTIGKDGRPIIAFNIPMLAFVRNDDEIAFILGHETAHQISNHLLNANQNANIGAVLLGSLVAASGGTQASINEAQNLGGALGARAYSKSFELEADRMGTYVAFLAGYDPMVGARSFNRLSSGGGGFLSTHPASSDRMGTVQRAVNNIRSDVAAGRPVQLP